MVSLPRFSHGIQKLLPPLGLMVAVFAVYGVMAGFELLPSWDDYSYVIDNETIRGMSWSHVKQAFSSFYVSNYAPVHIISYMVDHFLWGLDPSWYHLENVLIHALNGVLFYLILCRLGMQEWQGMAAACTFLFHPVQVETVAWVSQRKTLLAMFFFLAGLHAYHSYLKEPRRLSFYLLAAGSLAAAMLSKSIAVIFPVVALLYDQAAPDLPRRTLGRRVLDKLPFLLMAAAVAAMAMLSQAEETGGGRRGYPGGTLLTTMFTMAPVLAGYLRDCFWPFDLSPYYEVKIRQYPDAAFLLSLVLIAALVAVGFRWRRKAPLLFFGLAFFFLALLPVLQIVPIVTLKNDRYLYFPLLGLSVALVAAGTALVRIVRFPLNRALQLLMVALLLLLPALAHRQALYWQNDITLWRRAVEVDPNNRFGWLQLAKSYTERGDSSGSVAAFSRYMQLRKQFGPVRGFEGE